VGCGAVISLRGLGAQAGPPIAGAFGAAVAVSVYSMAHVSGAHFNPAITIGFAAVGRFPWKRVPSYIAAQAAGAAVAAAVLLAGLGNFASLGATSVAAGVSIEQAVGLEVAFTFLLAFVIAGAATDKRAPPAAAGLAIGLAVTVGSLVAGPATGASLNPARSFGPALVAGVWDNFAVYVVGPVVGGVLGFLVYERMRGTAPPSGQPRSDELAAAPGGEPAGTGDGA
jgi:MIP family channel proteins